MQHKIRRFASGSLLIFLAAQLSGCSASQGLEPSKVTCNQFLTQMQAKQLSSAYTLLSSKAKATTTAAKTQKIWGLVESNEGKVQSWTQTGVNVYSGTGGSKVTLGYSLKCSKGTANATFVCVEENSKWLIQDFNFNIR